MKAILGVDADGSYRWALQHLKRLKFADLQVDALHVVELVNPLPVATAFHYRKVFEQSQSAGEELLKGAMQELSATGLRGNSVLLFGSPPAKLAELAEHADLVVVGSQRKGKWGSLFFGSVTRGLANDSPTSFLVGKSEIGDEGPIHALLAVDHSPYCDRCVDRFFEMNASGLSKVTLVTAHWADMSLLDMALKESHLDADDLYGWIEDRVRSRSEAIATRFRERGVEVQILISEQEPREAIDDAMESSGADLLVLGARGHGLRERLILGSVAMHAVVATPYSVLVIRA